MSQNFYHAMGKNIKVEIIWKNGYSSLASYMRDKY